MTKRPRKTVKRTIKTRAKDPHKVPPSPTKPEATKPDAVLPPPPNAQKASTKPLQTDIPIAMQNSISQPSPPLPPKKAKKHSTSDKEAKDYSRSFRNLNPSLPTAGALSVAAIRNLDLHTAGFTLNSLLSARRCLSEPHKDCLYSLNSTVCHQMFDILMRVIRWHTEEEAVKNAKNYVMLIKVLLDKHLLIHPQCIVTLKLLIMLERDLRLRLQGLTDCCVLYYSKVERCAIMYSTYRKATGDTLVFYEVSDRWQCYSLCLQRIIKF